MLQTSGRLAMDAPAGDRRRGDRWPHENELREGERDARQGRKKKEDGWIMDGRALQEKPEKEQKRW